MDGFIQKFREYNFVPIEDISYLGSPSEFFKTINENLKKADEVFILCLCIGTEEFSVRILDQLKRRNEKRMLTRIILDKNRAERTPSVKQMINERELHENFEFFDPSRAIFLFPKLKELYSVLHTKLFLSFRL